MACFFPHEHTLKNHTLKPKHHLLMSGDKNWKQKHASASEMDSAHPNGCRDDGRGPSYLALTINMHCVFV